MWTFSRLVRPISLGSRDSLSTELPSPANPLAGEILCVQGSCSRTLSSSRSPSSSNGNPTDSSKTCKLLMHSPFDRAIVVVTDPKASTIAVHGRGSRSRAIGAGRRIRRRRRCRGRRGIAGSGPRPSRATRSCTSTEHPRPAQPAVYLKVRVVQMIMSLFESFA